MSGTKLVAEKITSPFQLMAAWFSMLILLVSVFLTAAANISKPEWAAGYLVIFTSAVVLLVLGCVTLMLTKFRPHLQDGKEYAQWLKDKGQYSEGYVVKKTPSNISLESSDVKVEEVSSKDNISISIVNTFDSINLLENFKNKGYNVDVYQDSSEPTPSHEGHECIWIGSRIDPEYAIQIILNAVREWPHLKYLHLSNDGGDPPDYVHDQMFIGGASRTAQKLNLKQWSNADLKTLNQNYSLSEFHAAIRTKYS